MNLKISELVLKKYTSAKIKSEDFFKITSQPSNTCPLIDEAISENKKLIVNIESKISEINQNIPSRMSKNDDCDSSYCAETLDDSRKSLESIERDFQSLAESLTLFNKKIEKLRSSCENLRGYGQEIKDEIWRYINNEITKEQLLFFVEKIEKPSLEISERELANILKVKICYPHHEFIRCPNNCSSSEIHNNLSDLFEDISNVEQIDMPGVAEDAFINYNKIIDWVDEIESLAYKVMESFPEINIEQATQEYITSLNAELFSRHEHSKLEISSSYISKRLKDVSVDESLAFFLNNTENLILTKKLKVFNLKKESLIDEAKRVYPYLTFEQSLSFTSLFFDKAEELKQELSLFSKEVEISTPQHFELFKKPYYIIYSAVHDLSLFLSDYGANVFEEIK